MKYGKLSEHTRFFVKCVLVLDIGQIDVQQLRQENSRNVMFRTKRDDGAINHIQNIYIKDQLLNPTIKPNNETLHP